MRSRGAVRLALIYGSTREGRLCDAVSDWVASAVWSRGGFRLDEIDPLVLDLPARLSSEATPALRDLHERLAEADAFVVVTPEYNHGYPAALKAVIDSADRQWHGKPVAFVSYGGRSGGIRAVEQLRQVFAGLHTVTVRDSVGLVAPWRQLDDAGRLRPDSPQAHALERMLAQLHWWADLLRHARHTTPYEAVA